MKITFYKYTGDPKAVNKTLDESTALNYPEIAFNRDFKTIQPEIKLTSENDLSVYNYVQIDGKYYFVNKCNKYRTNFFIITLELDAVTTYKRQLLTKYGTVTQSQQTNYMSGSNIPFNVKSNLKTIKADYTFPVDKPTNVIFTSGVIK